MAQIFKAKTLVSNTGRFSYEATAPNLVYNTGDQTISGIKNFASRPTVNGTGVLLSGEAINFTLPDNIVYTTGNQTISGNKNFVEDVIVGNENEDNLFIVSGNEIIFGIYPTINGTGIVYTEGNQTISGVKTFDVAPILSGSPFITGIDLSSYVTTGQTGVFYPRNNPSGFITGVDLSSYITTGQTGVFYPRNNPSGFITGVNLAPYALSSQVVYTTGDQTISGTKNFLNNIGVSGTGVFNAIDLNNVDILSISGVDISIINGNVSLTNRPTVNNTGVVLSGELEGIITNTGALLNEKINSLSGTLTGNYATIIDLASTGSTLVSSINSLNAAFTGFTGNLDATYATDLQLTNTGITLVNSINSLSGTLTGNYVTKLNGQFTNRPTVNGTGVLLSGEAANITLPSTIVYTTGDQIISGNKTFVNNIGVSGTGSFNNVQVSNIDKLFLSGIDILITGNSSVNIYNDIYISGNKVLTGVIPQTLTNVVYTTGDQNISGTKNFYTRPTVNGTGVLLSGEASALTLPTTIVYTTGNQLISGNKTFLNDISVSGTGNFNNVKVSNIDKLFLSGIDIVITGNSSINVYNPIYVSGNTVLTGVNLSSYITTGQTGEFYPRSNPSGFITGVDLSSYVTTGQTGAFYPRNNPSGFITGVDLTSYALSNQVVYKTGDQIISGNKIFLNNIAVSGSGIFNALDLNNVDVLNLSGVDVSIVNGNVSLTNRPTVNGSGVLLSGEAVSSSLSNFIVYTTGNQTISGVKTFITGIIAPNLVYNTGDQTISGNKTFINNLEVQGTGIFNALDLSNISEFNFSGTNINLINGNVNISGGTLYISGNPVLTGVNLTSYITTGQTGEFYPRSNPSGYITNATLNNVVYTTGNQTISGIKTFAQTGSFDTLQITNKKLSSYNYVNTNFTFGNTYINIINSSNNITGTLPSGITSGINYYVKNLNTGILLITGYGQRSIDGFLNINLYKNESLQLLGVNNVGYTGWVTLSADNGVS
jgi:hypothetical protein